MTHETETTEPRNCCPQCNETTEFMLCDPEPPACSLCGWQDTERRLNLYECVTFDETHGASVRNLALLAEEVEEEGDELGAAKLYLGYHDVDSILEVAEARQAALYILEQTGGLPPIKLAIDSLDRARYLLSEIKAGNAYSDETLTRELGHITAALSVARELGEF